MSVKLRAPREHAGRKADRLARDADQAGRLRPALLDEVVAGIGAVLDFRRPADRALADFFRARPHMGHADRGVVAETAYAVLRRKRLLDHLFGEHPYPGGVLTRAYALAALVRLRGYSVRDLASLLSPVENEWLAAIKAAGRGSLPLAVDCDLPEWIVERLLPIYGDPELRELSHALAQGAPLDLRVNIFKSDRDSALSALVSQGVAAEPTPYSPHGVRLVGKPALARNPLFLDGTIEVQDEGSQLICALVAPRRGEMVVDFCAGAGGKSLALGALMRSTGRVYAFDVSEKRLAKLKPRLARSGLSNIHPQRIEGERDARVKRLAGKIDRVLVDAPCSGLGTLRRNPDLKWRQSPADVARLVEQQGAILDGAGALVKPGGRLVYATCSLLPEENEGVVEAFLQRAPAFRLVPVRDVLRAAKIELPEDDAESPYLRLLPHRHGTDGFFAAVLERAA